MDEFEFEEDEMDEAMRRLKTPHNPYAGTLGGVLSPAMEL